MIKILVVEPYKILQRAIAINFFPEHEVHMTDQVPEMSAFEQRSYDVAIIDAGALREKNTAGDLNRRVQDWPIPIIWLEETISTVAPVRDKLVVLRKPIAREDLLGALALCQAKGSTMPLATPIDEDEKLRDKNVLAPNRDPEKKRGQIIELVDVVEEEAAAHNRDKRLERKKE